MLERLAARQPLLLVLEDLQHASVSTLEAVHFLRRRLATARVLIAATVSPDRGTEALGALAEVGRRIELGPLSAADVAELAGKMGVAARATEVFESPPSAPAAGW